MSSCCLRWKKKHSFYFFLCYCFFTFLVPFFWKSQKCQISQHIKCLVKTQLKNSTQTIFQGSSPWATLILNSMFVVVVLYCVQLLPEVIIFKHAFYLFLCLSFFLLLSEFHLEFSEMPNSENIWCRIKTQKNSIQTIFQGGSPWATLILNSMFVVVVLYCVQFFLEVNIFQNDALLSFSFPLLILFSFLLS